MWIFLHDAFLSIVDKGGDGSTLLARARQAGDLERVFPEAVGPTTTRTGFTVNSLWPGWQRYGCSATGGQKESKPWRREVQTPGNVFPEAGTKTLVRVVLFLCGEATDRFVLRLFLI